MRSSLERFTLLTRRESRAFEGGFVASHSGGGGEGEGAGQLHRVISVYIQTDMYKRTSTLTYSLRRAHTRVYLFIYGII